MFKRIAKLVGLFKRGDRKTGAKAPTADKPTPVREMIAVVKQGQIDLRDAAKQAGLI